MSTTESVDGAERVQFAAQVYIYGYPLVYNLHYLRCTPFRTSSRSRP